MCRARSSRGRRRAPDSRGSGDRLAAREGFWSWFDCCCSWPWRPLPVRSRSTSSSAIDDICDSSRWSSNTPSFYCSASWSSTPSSGSWRWPDAARARVASRVNARERGDSPSCPARVKSVLADALSNCFLGIIARLSRARRACTRTRIPVNSQPSRASAIRRSGPRWRTSAATAPLAAPSSSSADLASMTTTCFASAGGRARWTSSCSAASRRWRASSSSRVDSPLSI
jgi:hypothetical protein